ncbi:hypothetical protein OIU77_028337 [Salix suchowensis]|uniref:Uncharacterized protein n=1 Tax=Salix suchowensis TaxID=1278906 RepID=A0ABQ9BH18_9ROSI|nr:hypothetical protein OIU77_028337 [Salix suchowensis]
MKSIWGEDCLEFKPERWLSPEGDKFEPPKDGYKFVAFNAGPEDLPGEGLGLLANEVRGFSCAAALPFITGSWSPCTAEDVSYIVHEEWAPCVLASSYSRVGSVSRHSRVSGVCLARLCIARCLQETTSRKSWVGLSSFPLKAILSVLGLRLAAKVN